MDERTSETLLALIILLRPEPGDSEAKRVAWETLRRHWRFVDRAEALFATAETTAPSSLSLTLDGFAEATDAAES